ncbi:hypothetical protein RJ639_014063 [Escallonia herrerae]|uniref:Uncharacterized protein n=1 Tax=Escallonia herrerae TaxID=1293975 RepID=A0AA89AP71_9ASTE|nr:hypothetical protein RJ639_014063 [Escallonia herrerae]
MWRQIERLLVGVITGVEANTGQTQSNSLARGRGMAKPCVEYVELILLEPIVFETFQATFELGRNRTTSFGRPDNPCKANLALKCKRRLRQRDLRKRCQYGGPFVATDLGAPIDPLVGIPSDHRSYSRDA